MSVEVAPEIAKWQEKRKAGDWDANPREFGIIHFYPSYEVEKRFPFYELPANATFLGLMGEDALCLMNDESLRVYDHKAEAEIQSPPADTQHQLIGKLFEWENRRFHGLYVLVAVSWFVLGLLPRGIGSDVGSYSLIVSCFLTGGSVVAYLILCHCARGYWLLLAVPVGLLMYHANIVLWFWDTSLDGLEHWGLVVVVFGLPAVVLAAMVKRPKLIRMS